MQRREIIMRIMDLHDEAGFLKGGVDLVTCSCKEPEVFPTDPHQGCHQALVR